MKNYLENIDREALRARAEQLLGYAGGARDCAMRWTDHAIDKAHGFSLLDYTILGVCLTSFGVWIGSCFSKCAKKLQGLILAMFTVSWAYLFWRIFVSDSED